MRSLQQYGADAGLDLGALTDKIASSYRSYVAKNCDADIANPSSARVAIYLSLELRLEALGASPVPEITKCAEDIDAKILCGGQHCAQGLTCDNGSCCRLRDLRPH